MASTASTSGGAGDSTVTQPSIRRLLLQHKRISLAVLAVLALVVGSIVIPEAVSAGNWKVSDSTTCSSWSSANPKQQTAYAQLYVQRHGSLADGATSPASVEAAVNNGCMAAFAYDEDEQVNVLQAINKQY
jgi:hypothetical protein